MLQLSINKKLQIRNLFFVFNKKKTLKCVKMYESIGFVENNRYQNY